MYGQVRLVHSLGDQGLLLIFDQESRVFFNECMSRWRWFTVTLTRIMTPGSEEAACLDRRGMKRRSSERASSNRQPAKKHVEVKYFHILFCELRIHFWPNQRWFWKDYCLVSLISCLSNLNEVYLRICQQDSYHRHSVKKRNREFRS